MVNRAPRDLGRHTINVSCIVCIKRNVTRFSSLQEKINSFNKKGKQQASGHHKMVFAQNRNKNMNIKATSFANSRSPNQMSHCSQWGSDWTVREGSATSSMCSRCKVILVLGRLRCC